MPRTPGTWHQTIPSLLIAAILALTGCATNANNEAELDRLANEASGVFGPDRATRGGDLDPLADKDSQASPEEGGAIGQPRAATDEGLPPGGWGVLLASAAGQNARAVMEAQRPQFVQLLARRDVRVSRQRSGYALVLGSYDTPGDPGAQRDLAFVKSFEVDGRRPFAQAHLMPPGQRAAEERAPVTTSARDDWNLATVRESLGREAGFTLQIGVFESTDRQQAMRAAENWARELRQEGEEAYFYHGRTASMVSLGVFGKEDWDALFDVAAPRVRELQRRFPTLRLEQMDRRRGRRDEAPSAQPSTLVIIPER